MCRKPGPTHNRYAARTNMMGGLVAGMHKNILPLAAGRTALLTTRHPQQQQLARQCPPIAHMRMQGQAPPPVYYTGMPSAGGSYCQRTNTAFPVHAPCQVIYFVGQYPPSARIAPMMRMPNQQASPMMSPYYAPNQQPYHAQNQANQQQQGYYF